MMNVNNIPAMEAKVKASDKILAKRVSWKKSVDNIYEIISVTNNS